MEKIYQKELDEFYKLPQEQQDMIMKDHTKETEEMQMQQGMQLFDTHDVDKDGHLDFEEYKAMWVTIQSYMKDNYNVDDTKNMEELKERFDILRDGEPKVSKQKFEQEMHNRNEWFKKNMKLWFISNLINTNPLYTFHRPWLWA